jgi:hypothetical protein
MHFLQPCVMARRGVQGGCQLQRRNGLLYTGRSGGNCAAMRAAAAATSPASARSLRP